MKKNQLKGTSDLLSPCDRKKILIVEIDVFEVKIGISGHNIPIIIEPFVISKS